MPNKPNPATVPAIRPTTFNFNTLFFFIRTRRIPMSNTTRKAHKLWDLGRRCAGQFFAGKHNANPLNIFGAFATTMTSERLSIQSVAPAVTVWPYWKGSFEIPIWRLGLFGGRDLYQSKSHPRLHNASQYKVLLCLLPFGRHSNVKLLLSKSDPHLGVRGT